MKRVIIMGAAGRDFHNFNVCFRSDPAYQVVAFTAAQIPYIEDRVYPTPLAGPAYPQGVPIYPESALCHLIEEHQIDQMVLAYSDIDHAEVMQPFGNADGLYIIPVKLSLIPIQTRF